MVIFVIGEKGFTCLQGLNVPIPINCALCFVPCGNLYPQSVRHCLFHSMSGMAKIHKGASQQSKRRDE